MVSQLNRIIFLFAAILVKETCCGRTCLSGDISLTQCPQNQTCVPTDSKQNLAYCECSPGFLQITDDLCLNSINAISKSTTTPMQDSNNSNMIGSRKLSQSSGVSLMISVVSCLFIIFVICIVYLNYRHRFLKRLWIKINQRRGNYDEVLIGQTVDDDDPPLA